MKNNNTEKYPIHAKLSKSFLMSQPAGNCIVSLTFSPTTGHPRFGEVVVPLTCRYEQWDRIVQSGAHQRNCLVYENKEAAEQCINKMLSESSEHRSYDPFVDVSLKSDKLSKSVLKSLNEGMVFMSRVILPDGSPEFSGVISPTTNRQEQWKRLVKQGIAQKRCFFFNNKADMEKYRVYMHNAHNRKDSFDQAVKGGAA